MCKNVTWMKPHDRYIWRHSNEFFYIKVFDPYWPMILLVSPKWEQVNINQETFYCVKTTNLNIMLRIAYLSCIQFEKSGMSYIPLFENRKKIKLKKFTDEKIILLHSLSE